MNIVPASEINFKKALLLLEKNNLLTTDIHAGTQLFVMDDGDEVSGTIAAEYNFEDALLRSLCVPEEKRKSGIGEKLVAFLEAYLQKQGIKNIFLLTTTAAQFFSRLGYEKVSRSDVPLFIQSTKEFSNLCPSTATLMKKEIA